MRIAICITLFLMMREVSSAQMGIRMHAMDTVIHTTTRGYTIINTSAIVNTHKQAIAPDLYTQHLGFFCRQELKMQQAHVPVTFRLGSMDQCNYLEQKPGYKY